ncbi:hypothetical protein AB4Z19_04230 [Pseudoduganella sp. RAF19]|uniref:hypothetical protein n=3 Tax=unclassified Pseudoduganella TaxID=2637179 RepID=UPI003F9A9544
MLTSEAPFFVSATTFVQVPDLVVTWQTSDSRLSRQLARMQEEGLLPGFVDVDHLLEDGFALGGDGPDRAVLHAIKVVQDAISPGSVRLIIELSSGNLRFLNGYGAGHQQLRQSIAGWKLEFVAGINDEAGLMLHSALCDTDQATLPCDNMALKSFFISAMGDWLRAHADAVLAFTSESTAVVPRGEFLRQYLRPMLLEPLQARLDELHDFVRSRDGMPGKLNAAESLNEKSGAEATLYNGARAEFVPTQAGWNFRDHVLLHWQEAGHTLHDRESEQDLQCTLALSTQPGEDGNPHPTMDVIATLTRYEWDSVKQELPGSKQRTYMGKAWARVSLQWSLRLQWHVKPDGSVVLSGQTRKGMPRTDAGTTGIYVVSDPLPHLLNVHRICQWWDNHPANLGVVRNDVAAPLAVATTKVFERIALTLAPEGNRHCRGLRINERGDFEIELGE